MTAPDGLTWQRSSACNGGNCLLVARTEQHVLLRDSKDPSAQTLALTLDEFAAFLLGAKRGEFDAFAGSSASVASASTPASTQALAGRDSVRE